MRPLICRSVYVLDTADNCLPDRAPPKIVSHPALENAFREATRACADAGERLGRGAARAIPDAVAAALAAAGTEDVRRRSRAGERLGPALAASRSMYAGGSFFLIAIGAILYWAISSM